MEIAIGLAFVTIAAWMVWVPWMEHRESVRTGAPRLGFSRMLLRMMGAFCICAIGLMILGRPYALTGRSRLFEAFYLLGALLLAFALFLIGLTDYLFVKRDLLLGRRELLRDLRRSHESRDE